MGQRRCVQQQEQLSLEFRVWTLCAVGGGRRRPPARRRPGARRRCCSCSLRLRRQIRPRCEAGAAGPSVGQHSHHPQRHVASPRRRNGACGAHFSRIIAIDHMARSPIRPPRAFDPTTQPSSASESALSEPVRWWRRLHPLGFGYLVIEIVREAPPIHLRHDAGSRSQTLGSSAACGRA